MPNSQNSDTPKPKCPIPTFLIPKTQILNTQFVNTQFLNTQMSNTQSPHPRDIILTKHFLAHNFISLQTMIQNVSDLYREPTKLSITFQLYQLIIWLKSEHILHVTSSQLNQAIFSFVPRPYIKILRTAWVRGQAISSFLCVSKHKTNLLRESTVCLYIELLPRIRIKRVCRCFVAR